MHGPLHQGQKGFFVPIAVDSRTAKTVDDDDIKEKRVVTPLPLESPVLGYASAKHVTTPPTTESCIPASPPTCRSSQEASACDAISSKSLVRICGGYGDGHT